MSNENGDIYLERDGAIATIVINRPTIRNAISYDMWLVIKRLAIELNADDGIRVVVFRGAGDEAFSAACRYQ